VKRISQESIENIRSDGNVFNINVDEKSSGAKSHLPGSPQEPKYSQPKQVGVIRPISREAQDAGPMPKVKKILSENKTKTNSVLVSNLNKVNNNRTEENRDPSKAKDSLVIEKGKETLVIEKDPVFVPVESWLTAAQKRPTGVDARPRGDNVKSATTSNSSSSSSSTTSQSPTTAPLPKTAPASIVAAASKPATTTLPASTSGSSPISPLAPVLERLQPVSSAQRQPPSVPPRNGSRLEHGVPATSTATTTTTPATFSPPPITLVSNGNKEESGDVPDKGSSSYREAWKASKDQQNSLVFNFVGAKKDVSHIENDGLDLSSRAKSQGKGVILLDPGESNDGEEDEGGSDLKLNVTWVGAEVTTGKSSLRSKNNTKKLNISFNDKTEVFEYPSFEPVDPKESPEEEPEVSARLKSNTPVGSSGGLGSYTPSKIHLSDSPFLLGVSRSGPSPNNPLASAASSSTSSNSSSVASSSSASPALVPADHGVSWGRAASSDMLF